MTKYDLSISDFFENIDEEDLPKSIYGAYYKSDNLRYGENPHQKAAFYKLSNKSPNGICLWDAQFSKLFTRSVLTF